VCITGDKPVDGPILLHKGKEFIAVTAGALKITIDDDSNILEEGDSLLVTRSFVSGWQNAGETECRFMYILF